MTQLTHRTQQPCLRAADVMTRDLATLSETATVSQARGLMRRLGVRHLPVIGPAGFLGLLHASALRPQRAGGPEGTDLAVDRAARDVPRVRPDTDLALLEALIAGSGCAAVVVTDEGGRLVGIVTDLDLAATVAARQAEPGPRTLSPLARPS